MQTIQVTLLQDFPSSSPITPAVISPNPQQGLLTPANKELNTAGSGGKKYQRTPTIALTQLDEG